LFIVVSIIPLISTIPPAPPTFSSVSSVVVVSCLELIDVEVIKLFNKLLQSISPFLIICGLIPLAINNSFI